MNNDWRARPEVHLTKVYYQIAAEYPDEKHDAAGCHLCSLQWLDGLVFMGKSLFVNVFGKID